MPSARCCAIALPLLACGLVLALPTRLHTAGPQSMEGQRLPGHLFRARLARLSKAAP